MCDYSLQAVRSRPAKVGDRLVTKGFGTGTRGLASVDDPHTAVCVLPGTELAFARPIRHYVGLFRPTASSESRTAIFRQINKETVTTHHDALELPDGKVVLLNRLTEGQEATVLQLPAAPRTIVEAEEQERLPISA
jgi:hypothetical protein